MLILQRKDGQRVFIKGDNGKQVVITVFFASGKIRLGIEADRSFTIHREEVLKRLAATD